MSEIEKGFLYLSCDLHKQNHNLYHTQFLKDNIECITSSSSSIKAETMNATAANIPPSIILCNGFVTMRHQRSAG